MSTLYKKRNSPNWYAQFFDSNGDRISRSTGTAKKREAEKIATKLEANEFERRSDDSHLPKQFSAIIETAVREAASGELNLAKTEDYLRRIHQLANPSFRVVSVKEHLTDWVESQKHHVSSKSIATYYDMVRRMTAALGHAVSAKPIGELTKSHVEKAHAKIVKMKVKGTKRTIKAATANMDLRALRRSLNDAVEKDLARINVAQGVRPLPETDSKEVAPFTLEEVRTLIDHSATSEQWKGAILIAAHTGLRLSDIIRLEDSHIQGTRLVIRPEKTKRSRKSVTVPLTPPCLKWIEGKKGDLFPKFKGTKTGTLSTQFIRIMERANVPREIIDSDNVSKRRSFHSLRHTFASWLADADVHADVRQKLTGHQSAGVHGRYSHHDEALDRAVAQLPEI
jgi:integrase